MFVQGTIPGAPHLLRCRALDVPFWYAFVAQAPCIYGTPETVHKLKHESDGHEVSIYITVWIPAFAGMTDEEENDG